MYHVKIQTVLNAQFKKKYVIYVRIIGFYPMTNVLINVLNFFIKMGMSANLVIIDAMYVKVLLNV